MNNLILYCPTNRLGTRDGDEFEREAYGLADVIGGALVPLEGSAPARRRRFRSLCDDLEGSGLGRIAYLGHGTARGFTNWYTLYTLGEFAEHLVRICSPGVTIATYSCLTGKKFNGALAKELHRRGLPGARVVGHSTRGHTTRNPNVTIHGDGETEGPLLKPLSDDWKTMRDALKTTWRFRYPWLRRHEILCYLRGEDTFPPMGPTTIIPERP